MTEMTRRAKAWSYVVAYFSLAVGAGISMAGNVADTYRIAGDAGRTPDGLDIVIAGFWPLAVLLVIEMFVSRLWPARLGAQMIRWTASLIFGFITAFMSWIHLSDLLASRDQPGTVATLGPLAIDGLAIMATALILANRTARAAVPGRGLGTLFSEPPAPDTLNLPPVLSGQELEDALSTAPGYSPPPDTFGLPGQIRPMPRPMSGQVPDIQDMSSRSIWARLDSELDGPDSTLPVPVSPAPGARVRPDSVPIEARTLIEGWSLSDPSVRPSGAEADRLVAGLVGKHPRTVRGWRRSLVG